MGKNPCLEHSLLFRPSILLAWQKSSVEKLELMHLHLRAQTNDYEVLDLQKLKHDSKTFKPHDANDKNHINMRENTIAFECTLDHLTKFAQEP